jgi:phosphonate transport system ATP-binding protein
MPSPPTYELKSVERSWGQRIALAGVDLTITPGERVALLGPSGSGKTTILKLLMASLRVTKGDIGVNGVNISDMTPKEIRNHRRLCALVDQGAQVIPRLSVHDNVVAGRVSGWPWWRVLLSAFVSVDKDEVYKLLDDVGLADRQWDRADQLSGGQRQRVSIARALAGEPSVLLADEPTAALDPTTSAEVIALLGSVTRKCGATLIISTHRASSVLHEVDRIIGVREGKICLDCSPDEADDEALGKLYEGSRERT